MKNNPMFLMIALVFLATSAFAGPVSHFGRLVVCGNNICGDKTGTSTPVFFKGPSLFWSDGDGADYYKPQVVDWLVDNMQIGIIRAAMAIRYYDSGSEAINKTGGVWGYYFDKPKQKSLVKAVIDAAIENDIYVIVDWHSHVAHNETSDASAFFVEIANEYKNVPNIIWEVYNEPIGATNQQITSHANTIITALRNAGNNNLVVVGSPNYSQQPNEQASNFGNTAASKNVAFTFHFYAGTHPNGGNIGTSAKNARTAGYAVFGTEWGITNADGDGGINTGAADTWTTWMDTDKVSNCMWSASAAKQKNNDKAVQASSIFALNTVSAAISSSDLTSGSGQYFKTYMGKNKWTSLIPSTNPKGNDIVASVQDGSSVTLSSTQLDLRGDITEVGAVPFGDVSISTDKKSITYTTPAKGSEAAQVKFIYKVTQGSITIQSKATINITNRRPIVPEKPPIAVSRKAPTDLNVVNNLSVTDPSGQGLEFSQVSVSPASMGTATISSTKTVVTFTPAASQHDAPPASATLEYTVKSKSGPSNSGSVVLQLQNFAPTIRPLGGTFAPSVPNTEPVGIGLGQTRFSANDKDGDEIWFDKFYLHDQYPGTWAWANEKHDSVVYTPDPAYKGKITFLAVVTDGSLNSPTGGLSLTLTGNGTDIGNLPSPTEIPGVIDPPVPIISQLHNSGNMGIKSLGKSVEVYFAQSGNAKLDVYSLSGKNMGTLLSGHQNAGSKEVSLRGLNLQKGVYILRLSQGSQVKILRVVQ